ncbi:CDGSH iron-sulfur domain-containing protein [Salinigranum salinum]|uniref:CDGSH iron-sulfur domain-containing protein n=1 Tax=Salinigranum salinum TaxID=1364937 RepID=UPI0012608AAF|nr:CDGSH iron-sulfur domain-containing protein [Salinigranum salinum]
MAREITHEATGPLRIDAEKIEERGGSVLVCRCGLSAAYPFCDGSHGATDDEVDGRLYEYAGDDDEGERREIVEVVEIELSDGTGDHERAGERDENGGGAGDTA